MAVLSNMQEERFNTPRTNVWERFIIYISRSLSSWDLVWPWYRMKFLGLYLPTTLNRPLQVISWLVKEWSVGHSFIGWSLDLPTTGCKLRKVNLMASDNLRRRIYIYICHGYLWCLEPCKYLPGNEHISQSRVRLWVDDFPFSKGWEDRIQPFKVKDPTFQGFAFRIQPFKVKWVNFHAGNAWETGNVSRIRCKIGT